MESWKICIKPKNNIFLLAYNLPLMQGRQVFQLSIPRWLKHDTSPY